MTGNAPFSLGSSLDPAEFDEYEHSYDEALDRGLRLTGERKDYYARARLTWLRSYLDREAFQPGAVLDFGCGTGTGTALAYSILGRPQVTGVDVSAGLLAAASRHATDGVSFREVNALPATEAFDLALCNGVFHHIDPRERLGALAYIRQRLRPGGIFAMWENNPWNPGTRLVMRRVPFDRNATPLSPLEGRRLLSEGGFLVQRVAYLFYFPRALRVLRPIERLLTRVPLGGQYCVLARRP